MKKKDFCKDIKLGTDLKKKSKNSMSKLPIINEIKSDIFDKSSQLTLKTSNYENSNNINSQKLIFTNKLSHNIIPYNKIPVKAANKIPLKSVKQIQVNPVNHISVKQVNKIPVKTVNQIPVKQVNKIPVKTVNQIPVIPINHQNRNDNNIFKKNNNNISITVKNTSINDKPISDFFPIKKKEKEEKQSIISFQINRKINKYDLYKKNLDSSNILTLLKKKK